MALTLLTARNYAIQALDMAKTESLLAQGRAQAYQVMALRLDPDLFCQDCGVEYSVEGTTREAHETNCPSEVRRKPRRPD